MADYLIAGICPSRSAALLTRNREHFRAVIFGLTVSFSASEDPRAWPALLTKPLLQCRTGKHLQHFARSAILGVLRVRLR